MRQRSLANAKSGESFATSTSRSHFNLTNHHNNANNDQIIIKVSLLAHSLILLDKYFLLNDLTNYSDRIFALSDYPYVLYVDIRLILSLTQEIC